jgi:hypothetical protein
VADVHAATGGGRGWGGGRGDEARGRNRRRLPPAAQGCLTGAGHRAANP